MQQQQQQHLWQHQRQQQRPQQQQQQQQLAVSAAALCEALSFLPELKQNPKRWDLLVIGGGVPGDASGGPPEFSGWGPFNPYLCPKEGTEEWKLLQQQLQQQRLQQQQLQQQRLQQQQLQQQQQQVESCKRLDEEQSNSNDNNGNSSSCSNGSSSKRLTSSQAYRLWSTGLLQPDQQPDAPWLYSSSSSLAYNRNSTLPVGDLLDLTERRVSAVRTADPLEVHKAALKILSAAVYKLNADVCCSRRVSILLRALQQQQLLIDRETRKQARPKP